jgi:hypothetical protein
MAPQQQVSMKTARLTPPQQQITMKCRQLFSCLSVGFYFYFCFIIFIITVATNVINIATWNGLTNFD